MLSPGRVFRILYIPFCHCLRIFNFLLDYIARNCSKCFILLAKYKLIMDFMSRLLPSGYFSMSYIAFASLAIALSFSNSYHFWLHSLIYCRVNAGKNVKCQSWLTEQYTPIAGGKCRFPLRHYFYSAWTLSRGFLCSCPCFLLDRERITCQVMPWLWLGYARTY